MPRLNIFPLTKAHAAANYHLYQMFGKVARRTLMKTLRQSFILTATLIFFTQQSSFAWGKTGHSIVAQIAMHLASDATKQKVRYFLKDISIEDAGNWMDSMRSNTDYDFMRPWHYLDFEKGQLYSRPLNDDNIVP